MRWLLPLFVAGCVTAPVTGPQCQFSRYLMKCCDNGECTYEAIEPTVSRAVQDEMRFQRRKLLEGIEQIEKENDQ